MNKFQISKNWHGLIIAILAGTDQKQQSSKSGSYFFSIPTLKFGVEFKESVDEAGKILFDCACRAGFGRGTYLHSVGDGATWIFGQVKKQFGYQGHYLVDFCHVCEYLEAAAPTCSGGESKASWVNRQKEHLKKGQAEKIIEALKPYLEPEKTEDHNAPVRCCLRTVRLSRCSGTGPACRFRRNRECAPVHYSGASKNSGCMVDTGKCPNHACPES